MPDPPKSEVEVIPDYKFRRQSIYTVKADGSGLVELAWSETPNSAPETRFGSDGLRSAEEGVSAFRWSPDGKRIAFAARRYGEKDGIYIADSEGASVRRIFDLSTVSDLDDILDHGEHIYEIAWTPDGSSIEFEAYVVRVDVYTPAAYSVSADGSDLRHLAGKEPGDGLELSEKIKIGSGPKRIVIHDSGNPNAAPEVREWILSTAPWGKSQETVLVKIVNNRLTAVDSSQPVDVDEECSKAVSQVGTTGRTTRGQRNSGLMEDCRTLLKIKNALAYDTFVGDGIFNWSGYRPISEWGGITVEDGRVRALEHILDIPLRGTVPPQIAELTELRTLRIRHNELEGEIPPELGSLSKLETLDVGKYWDGQEGGSRVAGRIPPELGSLSNLKILNLTANELEGEIPPELGSLSKLRGLGLGSNKLHGEIPAELGSLSNLEHLHLDRNDLEGEIPSELGEISSLIYADLSENDRLTGCIPPKRGLSWEFYPKLSHCE